VDRVFNRPCGRPLTKLLVHTPITPNAVTLASIAIGLVAAWFFAIGTYAAAVFAVILFQLSTIVDCVDGDLARVLFKESPFGKWLDLGGDQVVHVAVFAAIAVGLVHSGQAPYGIWLGLSAVLGAVLSFAVVARGLRRPANHPNGLLSKLIDSATNRDFSVLILVLAGIGRLEWFLWMTAIGSHLFWMTALALQLSLRSEGTRAR
jgi:phosphatidylglycerophosphate synthase